MGSMNVLIGALAMQCTHNVLGIMDGLFAIGQKQ